MVAIISKTKREKEQPIYQAPENKKSSGFAGELDKAMQVLAPNEVQTFTYNSKSQLEPFLYVNRREYTI